MRSNQDRMQWPPGLVAAALVGVGCASAPKPPQAHRVELLVDNPKVARQTLSGVDLEFPWQLENGGTANATVDNVRWTLSVDGYPDQTGMAEPAVSCPPHGTISDRIRVGAPLSMVGSAGAAAGSVTADAVVRYGMEATFDVGTLLGPEAYVAEWRGEMLAPRQPAVTVHTDAARYGGHTVDLHFAIGVENPNPFPLPLHGLEYRVFVDDVQVASGHLAQGETVGPGAELQFEVNRLVVREDLRELAAALAGRNAIPYRVDSEVRAEDLALSIPVTGEIRFAD